MTNEAKHTIETDTAIVTYNDLSDEAQNIIIRGLIKYGQV